MNIRPLTGLSLEVLCEAFNEAFADYFVPFQLTPAELTFRMRVCSMRLDWSVGCFEEDGRLVAFIMNGCRETEFGPTLYNGGTGVLPAWRGRRLTQQMYDWLLPKAQAAGIRHMVLEVIQENQKALRAYEVSGFHITRGLGYWVGSAQSELSKPRRGLEIKLMEQIPWPTVQPWWSIQPAWPAQIAALEAVWPEMTKLGAFLDGQLVGYMVYLDRAHRTYQLCVDPEFRRRGIGRALVGQALQSAAPDKLNVANLDEGDPACEAFFTAMGFEHHVRQWEMVREV